MHASNGCCAGLKAIFTLSYPSLFFVLLVAGLLVRVTESGCNVPFAEVAYTGVLDAGTPELLLSANIDPAGFSVFPNAPLARRVQVTCAVPNCLLWVWGADCPG